MNNNCLWLTHFQLIGFEQRIKLEHRGSTSNFCRLSDPLIAIAQLSWLIILRVDLRNPGFQSHGLVLSDSESFVRGDHAFASSGSVVCWLSIPNPAACQCCCLLVNHPNCHLGCVCPPILHMHQNLPLKMIALEVRNEKENVLRTTNSLIAHVALPVVLLKNISGVKPCLLPWCHEHGTAISEGRRKLWLVYPWNYWQPSCPNIFLYVISYIFNST